MLTTTVLIPTWKRPTKLSNALQSLLEQKSPPTEVLVVVREIDKESQSVICLFKEKLNIRQLIVDRPGVIFAENCGLKEVKTNLTLFLDDDAIAPATWIESIIYFFENHPEASGLGGSDIIKTEPHTYWDFPVEVVGVVTWYGKIIGNHHRKAQGSLREVDVLKGVNMAFRTSDLKLLDQKLTGADPAQGNGSYWEADLCLGLRKKQKKIYFDPNLVVIHDSNHSHVINHLNILNGSHNLTYVMLKNMSLLKKLSFIFYSLLIGNGQTYGLLKFLTTFNIRNYYYSMKGWIKGFSTYLVIRHENN